MLVVVAAPHRGAAFAALAEVVEALKHRVPVWKKECYAGGDTRWL